jgi:acyl carrier protein
MKARLEQLVRDLAGPDDAGPIGADTTFAGLGLDSYDMVSLVMDVEQAFGIRLSDQVLAGLSTFGALEAAVAAAGVGCAA